MRHTKDVVKDMGQGWNLGNAMDCFGGEEAWGNPKTTKKMIDTIADAGFHTLRIPVTWHEQTGPKPEYCIHHSWLKRVKEIVDYGYENNMYVIINMHHENKWIKPMKEGFEEVLNQYTKMWRQIADYFKEYDEHLLFEALNEPRIEFSDDEWTGGSSENRQYVNELEHAFIQVVRGTGGNNHFRSLLITTVGASVSEEAVQGLHIPQDGYVGVSVHPYVPHHFCYAKDEIGSLTVWDGSLEKDIDEVMERLDRVFVSKGNPVVITEYGAVNKLMYSQDGQTIDNEDEVIKWVDYYLNSARKYCIPCIWWDNGYYSSGDEYFGIFNRAHCTWFRDKLKTKLTSLSK